MPDFDRDQLSATTPQAHAYILSVMFFPKDPEAQRAAQPSLLAEMLVEALSQMPDISLGAAAVRAIWETPRLKQVFGGRSLFTALRPGVLAGIALSFIIRTKEHGYPELASRGATLRGLSEMLRSSRGCGIDTLKKTWEDYRSVAHLWAFAVDYFATYCAAQDRELLLISLAHAEDLGRRGEAHVPLGASTRIPALNPTETWKVPHGLSLPSVTTSFPPPSPDDLRWAVLGISTGVMATTPVGGSCSVLPRKPPTMRWLHVVTCIGSESTPCGRAYPSRMCIYSG